MADKPKMVRVGRTPWPHKWSRTPWDRPLVTGLLKKEELEECPHCGSEYCEAHPYCENCELEPWAQEEL